MSPKPISPIRRAWYRWKALRLPWRKKFLVGLDLSGNTFWEFRNSLSPNPSRMRRIVHYPATVQYSEVTSKISPAWHQWLRHTRSDPPTLTEQSQDLVRQENLKILAAQADARWAAKPSLLDALGKHSGPPVPSSGMKESAGHTKSTSTEGKGKEIWSSAIGARTGDNVSGADTKLDAFASGREGSEPTAPDSKVQAPDGKRHPLYRGSTIKEQAHETPKDKKDDPWKRAGGGPSEEWQPQAWEPNIFAAKR